MTATAPITVLRDTHPLPVLDAHAVEPEPTGDGVP